MDSGSILSLYSSPSNTLNNIVRGSTLVLRMVTSFVATNRVFIYSNLYPFVGRDLSIIVRRYFFARCSTRSTSRYLMRDRYYDSSYFEGNFTFHMSIRFLNRLMGSERNIVHLRVIVRFNGRLYLRVLRRDRLLNVVKRYHGNVLRTMINVLVNSFCFLRVSFNFFSNFFTMFCQATMVHDSRRRARRLQVSFLRSVVRHRRIPRQLTRLLNYFASYSRTIIRPMIHRNFTNFNFTLDSFIFIVQRDRIVTTAISVSNITRMFNHRRQTFSIPTQTSQTPE